jgi:predicted dehydrogenase
MEPVRVGVIGCGVIGTHHLSTATKAENVELIAIADLVESLRQSASERFQPRKVYADGQALIADPEIEAVVLAFPTAGRTRLALAAFGAGKHVLTEKPVAMNAGEVRQMIAAKGDLVAGCCSSRYRFVQGADAVTDFIATGALGPLRLVRHRNLSACGPQPTSPRPEWRLKKRLNGGGYLVNWGCYDLDYLLGITGWTLKPKTVFAQTWTVPPQFESHVAPGSDAETHYIALIRCEGGTILSLERGEYMPAQSENAWQIVGTKGSLRLHMTETNPKRILFDDTTTEHGVVTRTVWEGEEDRSRVHAGPLTDFADAIRGNRPPKTSLENALVMQQITDAIYQSAETGSSVNIE